VFGLMGLFSPGLQALMSHRVTPQEQGKLQGANTSIIGIAGMVGPIILSQSFAYCIAPEHGWTLPGAPFFLAGLMLVLALLLALSQAREPEPPAPEPKAA
jgi:MFS transporter, DHA1 family, tetracycline resistance protein